MTTLKLTKLAAALMAGAMMIGPAYPQQFAYTFGGGRDDDGIRLLATFGQVSAHCGSASTNVEIIMTLDADISPPMVSLNKVGGGLIFTGPVARFEWVNTTAPNEFGRWKPASFLWTIDFKTTGGEWRPPELLHDQWTGFHGIKGTGSITFALPPNGDGAYLYINDLHWPEDTSGTYSCYPTMVKAIASYSPAPR